MTKLSVALASLLVACAGERPTDEPDDPDPTGEPPPPASAASVTLARATIDGAPHLVVVTGETADGIDGRDLGVLHGSALDRVRAATIDGLLQEAETAPTIHVPAPAVLAPVETAAASINVAENYVDHAMETDTGAAQPYLFPKVAATTPAHSRVAAASAELLDYEVELCMAVGEDLTSAPQLDGALAGFFLCNDLSDRAVQIREADVDDPSSARGFTDAKSKPGYLPTGPFMVVTRDGKALLESVQLELAVNGTPRQRAAAADMVWAPAEIVAQTLAVAGQARWTYQGAPIALVASTTIPAGTVFVTGTPGGVVFAPPSQAFKLEALAAYLAAGGPFTGMGPEEYVREAYVQHEKDSGRYLKAGDLVTASATQLGRMVITID